MGDYESLVAETDHFEIGMINCPSLKTVTPIASTNCKLDSLEMVVAKIKLVPDITQLCPAQLRSSLPSSQLVTGTEAIPSVQLYKN